ncbi:hypothetical protein EJB05_35239, partial [Eragrostis curvula]
CWQPSPNKKSSDPGRSRRRTREPSVPPSQAPCSSSSPSVVGIHPRFIGLPPFQESELKLSSAMSFLRLLPQRLPQLVRQMEQDVETVIHVLQPGPIGIVEHKFTDAEIMEARATVRRAVENWRRNWTLERNLGSGSFEKWK